MFDLLTESKQTARQKLDDVILESLRMPKSADPGKLKLKDLTERSSHNLCKSKSSIDSHKLMKLLNLTRCWAH